MEKHTRFQSFYADVQGEEGNRCLYPTRLDTYGCGCQHDCAYCYARSLLDFRGLWHPEKPSVASIDYIKRKLAKVERNKVLRLGGMTDCFMPYEKKYRTTYQTIKMLNAREIGYLIVTKSDMIADSLYLSVLDPELAHIQIIVTSTSDEPNYLKEKAVVPSRRIEAAEKLQRLGYDVSIRVSPYVSELVDLNVLNRVKVDKCCVEFLRLSHWCEKWLDRDFPNHRVKSGGYKHLPLEMKIEMLKGFEFPEMTVCEDVPEHYEYFKRNYNSNPEDCCNLRKRED